MASRNQIMVFICMGVSNFGIGLEVGRLLELGWGGYWFWDPVENVALMPWLAATAFTHSMHALNKSRCKSWTFFEASVFFKFVWSIYRKIRSN